MTCKHEDFSASVTVHRITNSEGSDVIGYMADVEVACAHCNEPFAFIGPPVGQLPDEPGISVDALQLRAPIRPASSPLLAGGLAGFRVNFKQQRLAREKADA